MFRCLKNLAWAVKMRSMYIVLLAFKKAIVLSILNQPTGYAKIKEG